MCLSCPGLASQVARFLANLARTAMLRTAFVAQVGGEAARHEHSSPSTAVRFLRVAAEGRESHDRAGCLDLFLMS